MSATSELLNTNSAESGGDAWEVACEVSDLVPNSGVCALVNDKSIAIFCVSTGKSEEPQVFALSNMDPVGKAGVLSRGLLGSTGETFFVSSPLYKQRYCLETGKCLDDESLSVSAYSANIVADKVMLKGV